MAGSTEPSQMLMSVKEEIKEEEFDDFPSEYLFEIQKVEEKPELEHDCKTETHTSPTLTCKEENSSLMEIKEEPDLREYGDDDDSSTKVKSNMSGSTEPSQLLMPVKEEIKEEELDDFLQEHLSAIQKVEEKPGLEHDCKTEKSPSLTCKEENDPAMEIKEEEELDLREYGHDDSSPARDVQRIPSNKMGNNEEKNKERRYKRPQGRKTSYQKSQERLDIGENQHECSQCGKTFNQLGNLKRHQRIHTGEKPHQCATCGKSFRSSSDLSIHQITHTGEKPHLCSQCGNAFSKISNLNRHQRIHTGEKPYKCSTCEKSFRSSKELTIHQMSHTGEKPHQCSQCEKAFCQVSDLKKHQRIHTGEKPYQCTICEKSFKRSTHLTSHQITHR